MVDNNLLFFLFLSKDTKRYLFSPDRNGILLSLVFLNEGKKIEWMAGTPIANKAQAIRY